MSHAESEINFNQKKFKLEIRTLEFILYFHILRIINKIQKKTHFTAKFNFLRIL